jgi:hypothetical protein
MKASLIEMMPDIRGGYLLTANGGVGSYGDDNVFRTDERLSKSLSDLIQTFAQDLKRNRHTNGWRIGIVHTDHAENPWLSATLAFEDYVLRDLYPLPAAGADNLSAFQRGNREKSLFRGLELLLDHHDPLEANTSRFCPVLVYRNTTLAQYTPGFGRERRATDAQTPVVEVVNLLAGATLMQSCHPAVEQLIRAMRRNLIRPELRSIPNLTLLDEARETMTSRNESAINRRAATESTRRSA